MTKKLEAVTLCRDCGYDKRVELDANYVSDWRFSTDLSILVRTVGAVIERKGSY